MPHLVADVLPALLARDITVTWRHASLTVQASPKSCCVPNDAWSVGCQAEAQSLPPAVSTVLMIAHVCVLTLVNLTFEM